MYKLRKRNIVYTDAWVTLYQDEIVFPDGTDGTYAWVERKSGVAIVVVHEKKLLLSREYRYVIDDYSWEIPGGGIDNGETPEQAAIRELKEETGIEVETVEQLSKFYPLHSFNTELVTFFIAHSPTFETSTHHSEVGEMITERRWVTYDEALRMIDAGEISDGATIAATQMAIRKLKRGNEF